MRLGGTLGQLLFIVTQILDAVFDQPERVVLIVDREGAAVIGLQLLDVLAQNAHAETVKSRNPGSAGKFLAAQQALHALTHLLRGFVREGDGENVPGRHAFFADQVSDAIGDHARFAGAGTRQNQQRAVGGEHSFALLVVELGKELVH